MALNTPSMPYPSGRCEMNRRLSKRDHDAAIDELLARFGSPEAVIGYIAGITGIAATCEPATPEQLLNGFSLASLSHLFADNVQIAWR